MKLHFDPNQQFQIDAIKSVVDVFEGQSLNKGEFEVTLLPKSSVYSELGVSNRLEISDDQILENVKKIQERNEVSDLD